MPRMNKILFCVFYTVLACITGAYAQSTISDSPDGAAFPLVHNGVAAHIYVDPADAAVVRIAADALAGDIERVTGVRPQVKTALDPPGDNVVIIGTLDGCDAIQQLAGSGKLDVSAIKGQWETFKITTLDSPLPGVGGALVVAGSDRRGAAFGAFELSGQMGVSPWVWWADVTPDKKQALYVKGTDETFGPPSVKYRGVFLNDEDFGLKPWAAKTYEPETGDIGPKTYAAIFELLLRLKANHIWPAMHNCTRAFNHYDRNKVVADEYAIVMGSSHCEQMLRNNVDEWDHNTMGAWNFKENRESVIKYWQDRVEANGQYENVYTMGMRGIHDSGMVGGDSLEEKVEIIAQVIRAQRELLKSVNPDVTQVPQVFIPYKEVLELYWGGLQVPDDVTLVWADDNFGYIRRLSDPGERKRSGGAGVYYHISYWGPPHDYLWLNTTPPALIWEEMLKAYDYGARRVWIVNVGDIKPGEIGMELFLQMGWDIDRWGHEGASGFLQEWAAREFGSEYAAEIAEIMNDYYVLNYPRKPEHMGFYDKYSVMAKNQDPEFSLFFYGDEVQKRIDAFDELERRAAAVADQLPASKKDAYFQLVQYPVLGAVLTNRKHLSAYKSRRYARQDRASAAEYARAARDAYQQLEQETARYNNDIAGGKWKCMMSNHPNDLPVFDTVPLGKFKPGADGGLGVAVEGEARPVSRPDADSVERAKSLNALLPMYNRYTRKTYFIDLFNKGDQAIQWKAEPAQEWIRLSSTSGALDTMERILVDIDYDAAPHGEEVAGSIRLSGSGGEVVVFLTVFNPQDGQVAPGAFVQDNGVVSMNAESFSNYEKRGDRIWQLIPGLGRTGASMVVMPFTAPSISDLQQVDSQAPRMDYSIHIFESGKANVIIEAVPTHEIHKGRKLRVAVAVDDAAPQFLEFEQAHNEIDKIGRINVFRNMMSGEIEIELDAGAHTLKVWGVEPGVVLDKIILNTGGLRKSYLGPPETRAVE